MAEYLIQVMRMSRTYDELINITSFLDRIKYLKLEGFIGEYTFGGFRELNQTLYASKEWRSLRKRIILRDFGFDLAHKDIPILGKIYIHHINPLTIKDILERKPCVFDPNNLVCVSFDTHNLIHYGINIQDKKELIERRPNDTCPWR